MPRYARKKSESGIFHIMLRGINRQEIFEDDEDRERFLETIERYKDISKYKLYGYCLMGNHVHLLLKETEEPISTVIKRICSSYVYWYNAKYERSGHLFQERYKSEVVEDESYLLTVLRYIHQNPLKAGLVKSTDKYKWSSYNEYAEKNEITDVHFVLQLYSDYSQKAIKAFIMHTNEQNEDRCLDYDKRIRVTDNVVRAYLEERGIHNMNEFQQLELKRRNKIIREIKGMEGVSIRQLSRVTGISKSVIDRA